MEQVRRYLQSELDWARQDDRAVQTRPQARGDGPARHRRESVSPRATQEQAREVETPIPAPDADMTTPDRGAHMAALRRAIVLSEVIGPPRALRGDGGFR